MVQLIQCGTTGGEEVQNIFDLDLVWTPVDNVDNGVGSVKIGNSKYKKDLYLGKCGLTNYIFF